MKAVQILMMNQKSEGLGYGYLYNWYAVSHADFATSGWHVPTLSEYGILKTYLGGASVAGGKLKDTGYDYWDTPNTGATNSTGFTAYGAGYRYYNDGVFSTIKINGRIWLSTLDTGIGLQYNSVSAFQDITAKENMGYSVRLIKDSTTLSNGETSTMTDEDGNVYDTICIGTQEWTVQNWKCTKLNDGTSLTKVTSGTTWVAASTGDKYYCAYDNDESNV